MRIVVEGCGAWAGRYLSAIKQFAPEDTGVLFTYDSSFGFDETDIPLDLHLSSLQATQQHVERVHKLGYGTVDVFDAKYRLRNEPSRPRETLPQEVDVVIVATPDRTHCDVAEKWLGRAEYIFVEKPFDVSERRIEDFCSEMSKHDTHVRGIDHYVVRCNQIVSQMPMYARLLSPEGPPSFDSFEFRMTEPPEEEGISETTSMQSRALSLQSGIILDMGSHAMAMLLPFVDIETLELTAVWGGTSEELKQLMYEGRETFSIAKVSGRSNEFWGSRGVEGTIAVGKSVGSTTDKFFQISGPGGLLRFDFVKNYVYFNEAGGARKFVEHIGKDFETLLISELFDENLIGAVEMFQPEGAIEVVRFLLKWGAECLPQTRRLARHKPGASIEDLRGGQFRR